MNLVVYGNLHGLRRSDACFMRGRYLIGRRHYAIFSAPESVLSVPELNDPKSSKPVRLRKSSSVQPPPSITGFGGSPVLPAFPADKDHQHSNDERIFANVRRGSDPVTPGT